MYNVYQLLCRIYYIRKEYWSRISHDHYARTYAVRNVGPPSSVITSWSVRLAADISVVVKSDRWRSIRFGGTVSAGTVYLDNVVQATRQRAVCGVSRFRIPTRCSCTFVHSKYSKTHLKISFKYFGALLLRENWRASYVCRFFHHYPHYTYCCFYSNYYHLSMNVINTLIFGIVVNLMWEMILMLGKTWKNGTYGHKTIWGSIHRHFYIQPHNCFV